jgi:two-component system C4-dicarboxylate transport sensor histidine kinase DctB
MSRPAPPDQVAALAELGLIASSLVHELRQPLFAARGTLQLAAVDEGARPSIDEALRHLSHAAALLDQYAALGRSTEPAGLVDVSEHVRAALGLVAGTARGAGVAVSSSLAPRGTVVVARPSGVTQVAANLLRNAIEAVPADGAGRVRVAVEVVGDEVVLTVDDNGGGVPDAVIERLGEPWVTTKGPAGTGLGLYLSMRLVREAAGTLTASRNAGGGASLRVVWPAARPGS